MDVTHLYQSLPIYYPILVYTAGPGLQFKHRQRQEGQLDISDIVPTRETVSKNKHKEMPNGRNAIGSVAVRAG